MENQLKPAASLSGRLLARKGEAVPAESKLTSGIRAETSLMPHLPANAPAQGEGSEQGDSAKQQTSPPGLTSKRPVGAGNRIAMTLRLSHDQHTRLKILSAKLKRSSQEIMLDALQEYMSRHGTTD